MKGNPITLEDYSRRILRPSTLAGIRSGELDEALATIACESPDFLLRICDNDAEMAQAIGERLGRAPPT